MDDILFTDATGQLEALNRRSISARELLQASIDQSVRYGPTVNAIVAQDDEAAHITAQSVDERRQSGEPLGRLAGLPMTVKDTLDVAGLPASAGMPGLLDRIPGDAVVVTRVKAADAIVWGKSNTPVKAGDWQTYNALYGVTNNPWALDRTPGGSSGGSTAAVAVGISALEIGADIGGSLRIPASFCGVLSHKPTYGLVPQRGLVPPVDALAEIDMAVVGPVARSVRDLRLLLSVITDGRFSQTEPAKSGGLRVALWLDDPAFVVDPVVRQMIERFAETVVTLGIDIEPARPPFSSDELMFTYTSLLFALLGPDLPPAQRGLYELLRPLARAALDRGAGPLSWAQGVMGYTLRHAEWLAANECRAGLMARMEDFFTGFDALIAPTSFSPPFKHDHRPLLKRSVRLSDGRDVSYLKMMDWAALASTCGLPATTIPIGLTDDGLPVGVQIIGPHSADARTLALAGLVEQALGGYQRPNLSR